MKILEKTMEQMPNSFTSHEFNKKAISNGYPKEFLQKKGLSCFIRKYADNAYEGSKAWVKRSAKEKITKVAETQQLNRFAVNTRLLGVCDRNGNIKSVYREPYNAFKAATKLNRKLAQDVYFIDWVIVV